MVIYKKEVNEFTFIYKSKEYTVQYTKEWSDALGIQNMFSCVCPNGENINGDDLIEAEQYLSEHEDNIVGMIEDGANIIDIKNSKED